LLGGGRDGRSAVAANGKARHQQLPMGATLQTRALCDWKCIFLQWFAGSIFLKCEYPEKYNKISDLDAVIPRKRGVFNSGLRCGKLMIAPNARVCHEAGRTTVQAF
jgi:hypothetical protein